MYHILVVHSSNMYVCVRERESFGAFGQHVINDGADCVNFGLGKTSRKAVPTTTTTSVDLVQ